VGSRKSIKWTAESLNTVRNLPTTALWEGKLFVFDDRMQMGFSDKSKDIADCENCGKKNLAPD
jgi:predicted sulfurtransferase